MVLETLPPNQKIFGESWARQFNTVDLTPSTLNPQASTLNPQPSTLNPQPSALNPQPETLNPKPETRNPKPETLGRDDHTARRDLPRRARLCHPLDRVVPGKGIQTPMAQGLATKIISMIKWIRTSWLSIKESVSFPVRRSQTTFRKCY